MVTIANYLNGNFISAEHNEAERPICVLSGQSDEDTKRLWQYSINRSINTNRHHVIVDFGISYIKRLASAKIDYITDDRQLLRMTHHQNQYILIGSKVRKLHNLGHCLELLNNHVQKHKLTEVLLTIEGIPTLELFYSEEQITQFISGLSTLSAVYKQINILVSKQVNKRIVVSLERLSTCIISLDKKLEPSKWRCVMVVRRYTGFSNEQDYVIELTENQLKVNKHKQQTAAEPQMKDMGFSLKRSTKPEEMEQLKKIMFPYLSKQTDKKDCCSKEGCQCSQPEIVLDQQQQQDDDVDV